MTPDIQITWRPDLSGPVNPPGAQAEHQQVADVRIAGKTRLMSTTATGTTPADAERAARRRLFDLALTAYERSGPRPVVKTETATPLPRDIGKAPKALDPETE